MYLLSNMSILGIYVKFQGGVTVCFCFISFQVPSFKKGTTYSMEYAKMEAMKSKVHINKFLKYTQTAPKRYLAIIGHHPYKVRPKTS